MTVEEMKQKKKEKGYTYAKISELSGIPLGTIQKIFSGETMCPRYDTMQALERLFEEPMMVREEADYFVHKQGEYTIRDYRALPEERRVELIDGYFYDMASPTFLHQRIGGEIYRQIANFILEHGGDCRPIIAPVDVQLDCDEKTMVQPDVAVLCDGDRIRHWGIYGAPDFVLEVISPSTKKKDYVKKLSKYMEAGVREYWILDTYQKVLLIYRFESTDIPLICGLDQPVDVGIFEGKLQIQFDHILEWMEEEKQYQE